MQWLIDIILALIPPGTEFVDRGDPGAYDWTVGDFTTDNTWRDLDCSAIVPENAIAILFNCQMRTTATNKTSSFRKNGNASGYNIAAAATGSAQHYHSWSPLVWCDVNRVIEYRIPNFVWQNFNLVVCGWILKP